MVHTARTPAHNGATQLPLELCGGRQLAALDEEPVELDDGAREDPEDAAEVAGPDALDDGGARDELTCGVELEFPMTEEVDVAEDEPGPAEDEVTVPVEELPELPRELLVEPARELPLDTFTDEERKDPPEEVEDGPCEVDDESPGCELPTLLAWPPPLELPPAVTQRRPSHCCPPPQSALEAHSTRAVHATLVTLTSSAGTRTQT